MPEIPKRKNDSSSRPANGPSWLQTGTAVAVLLLIAVPHEFSQTPGGPLQTTTSQPIPGAAVQPAVNRIPDANEQMAMNQQQSKRKNFDAANLERRRQISEDTAKILQLATELKAEIDKTGKDTLSLTVIRKADAIEKLAKGVREKMKLVMGAS
jgi:hypothetical protein